MKLLRIKDNSQQKKDAFSQVARLTGKIADKTLEQLEREGVFVFPETVKDAEDITQDQMILQSVNDTYPDFISRNSEPRIIADAKYKPLDNIGNRDYLQVRAYMFRFDAKSGYYLYPEAEGSDDLKLWLNRGSTYEENVVPRDDISITKHGLKIPIDAQNYSEFTAKMKVQEQEFTSVFYA